MKKSISIRIPEPCHEDWQKMTQTEKGKFCQVCTKDVIDFTTKTDEELVKALKGTKNICGRFKKSQLTREVKLERKSGLNFAPYAASLLLPLSLLNTTSASSSSNNVPDRSYRTLNVGSFSETNRAIINTVGRITDASGKALQNVVIRANESKKIVLSDNNGYYSITTMDRETLSFESEGFMNQKVELGKISSEKNVLMISEIIGATMGEMEIAGDIVCEVPEDLLKIITINGTVRDESGLVIPGVNIFVEGTQIGTQTDFDGNYSIDVEANQILQFSYVGFETKSISVSNISNNINVNLELSEAFMGEVIVLGMIDYNEYKPPISSSSLAEMESQRKARKLAHKNGKEFRRLQREKVKAARKLKRTQRK